MGNELQEVLEEHGFNATVEAVGRPRFDALHWVDAVVGTVGGFVGHIKVPDTAAKGFLAFVPGDKPSQTVPPSQGFIDAISVMPSSPSFPNPSAAARHFAAVAALLGELSSSLPAVEASYLMAGISIDLARGRHIANPGGTFIARQHGEELSRIAPRSAFQSGLASAVASGRFAPLEERIVRMKTGMTDGPAPTGFLVSTADSGRLLIVTGALSGRASGKLELRIGRDNASLSAGRQILLHAPVTVPDLHHRLSAERKALVVSCEGAQSLSLAEANISCR